MKIGLLIPSTSNNRDWKTYSDTYLYNYTLKTFLTTYDNEHKYIFYIGIDRGDKVYDTESCKDNFCKFCSVMKNIEIEFIYMDNIAKGHLTVMWNKLFEKAYSDNCDYFFQCGDDIEFKTKGWVNDCIQTLYNSNNIGMTGPMNHAHILTQSFVSRKHMELFGYYFPPEILNWCCDDWINVIYSKLQKFYPLNNHLCINVGGAPRYVINDDSSFTEQSLFQTKLKKLRDECYKIVDRDLSRISK